jgi:hypothetical protein
MGGVGEEARVGKTVALLLTEGVGWIWAVSVGVICGVESGIWGVWVGVIVGITADAVGVGSVVGPGREIVLTAAISGKWSTSLEPIL